VQQWGVEGKGWQDTERYFDRLPQKAKDVVRSPVWSLSHHSAGMLVRFETDATEIHARYQLLSARLGMPHMPPTGVSGVDLYGVDDQGRWRWVSVLQPTDRAVNRAIVQGLEPKLREFMLYLPLYNGVESLEIGVPAQAAFRPIRPRRNKPIVFYGTSIMQGACASRPGMAWSAIVGRRLDRPIINLGFAGNGRMEPEVGALLAELDPCVYVIDCLPNMDAKAVAERAEPLVRQLRKAHPDTPIILVEDRTYTNAPFLPARRQRNDTSRVAFRKAYQRLVASGVTGLEYVEGEHLLGDDGEASTDGSHPSDLGMMRQAEVLIPFLRRALGQ